MELYDISLDRKNWGKLYNDDMVAEQPWGLPGVHCSVCGQTWAITGVSYPLIGLSENPLGKQLEKARVVEFEIYESLRDSIKQYAQIGLPLPPGTTFGPLKGKIKGRFGDFVWRHLWDPLIRIEAYQKLVSVGLHMPATSSPIVQEKFMNQLFHLQIEPHGYLSPRSYVNPDIPSCPRCKRDGRKLEKVVMVKESIPNHLDIFRIGNFPTYILVTERFKDAVDQLGLTNILFEKVELE